MTKKDREILESIQSEIRGLKQSLKSLKKNIQNINPLVYKYAIFYKERNGPYFFAKLESMFKSSRVFNKGDYHVNEYGTFRKIVDFAYYEPLNLILLITPDIEDCRSSTIRYIKQHPEEFIDNDQKR